jgi:hypothetical protein
MFIAEILLKVAFSNISAISWGPVLVVEEAGVPPFFVIYKTGREPTPYWG